MIDPFGVGASVVATGSGALPVQPRGIADDVQTGRAIGQPCRHVDDTQGVVVIGTAEGGGLDLATGVFEFPVTPGNHIAGGVIAGGHVGAGEGGYLRHKGLAHKVQRHVAAIQHQVAVGGKVAAQQGQVGLAAGHVVVGECEIAQLQLAVGAVGEQVDGREVAAALQCLGELGQAIAVGVNADDGPFRRYIGHQGIAIRHRGIDHDDLALGLVAQSKDGF